MAVSQRYSWFRHVKAVGTAVLFALMMVPLLVPHTSDAQTKLDYNEGKDISTYDVIRTTGAITVDGKLDEADWKRAEERVCKNARTGEAVLPLKTTVRLLWDDTCLYVAFYCEDPDAWTTFTEEDDPVWNEEVAEIFIDADADGFTYIEYDISPMNVKSDLYITNAGKRLNGRTRGWRDWDFRTAKSAVYVEGDGRNYGTDDKYWTVEVALPFDEIWELPKIPPDDGDMWRFNAYRIERGDPEDEEDDFRAALSPTYRNFHTPWQFAKIYFRK